MTLLMPRIASRLFGEPLMVDAGKLAAIMAGIGGRVVEGGIVLPNVTAIDHAAFARGRPSEQLGIVGDPMGRAVEAAAARGSRVFDMVGSTAIIAIEGTLVGKGKWIGQDSGETSYEGIQAQVGRATRDPSVKSVVFEVDSFGGEGGSYALDTAAAIARLSAQKPTLAILTDFAMSAGYLLASAARQIVMPETGAAGSIGVISMHVDQTKRLEDQGYKVTLITAGAHKADGHPALPLSEAYRAEMQARVDRLYALFTDAVGVYRGTRLTREAAVSTEARIYSGEAAVAAGLVDGIGNPADMFSAFVARTQ
jgi:signal peptide peptidase SppA